MQGFFDTVQLAWLCVTVLGIALLILLSLPQSRLRSVTLESLKYMAAIAFCLMVISPIDLIPDIIPVLGWGDDLGYIAAAITSVKSALNDRKQRKLLL